VEVNFTGPQLNAVATKVSEVAAVANEICVQVVVAFQFVTKSSRTYPKRCFLSGNVKPSSCVIAVDERFSSMAYQGIIQRVILSWPANGTCSFERLPTLPKLP
jgi:hypothetical protein